MGLGLGGEGEGGGIVGVGFFGGFLCTTLGLRAVFRGVIYVLGWSWALTAAWIALYHGIGEVEVGE